MLVLGTESSTPKIIMVLKMRSQHLGAQIVLQLETKGKQEVAAGLHGS